jgi:hypothetical protein
MRLYKDVLNILKDKSKEISIKRYKVGGVEGK